MAAKAKQEALQGQAMDLVDIASYLRISERTAWELIRRGEIPAKQVGRQWRSTRDQLDSYLAKKGI